MTAAVAAQYENGVAAGPTESITPKQRIPAEPVSNEYVLNVAFVSFVGFMLLQGVFAIYVAHSQAMLADTEAMSVDSATYLFNMWAERIKNRPLTDVELKMPQRELDHRMECKRLWLELVPPAISVATLITVTIATLKEAGETLWGQMESGDKEDDVSAGYMLLFSGLNLLLDVVNVACFARAHQAYGLQKAMTVSEVVEQDDFVVDYKRAMLGNSVENEATHLLHAEQSALAPTKSNDTGDDVDQFQQLKTSGNGEVAPIAPSLRASMASRRRGSMTEAVPIEEEIDEPFFLDSLLGVVNLNMCSAWTHVCADTMRSVAVLVAAGIAFLFEQVPADKADSAAAIAVSITILLSLIPLLRGLLITSHDLALEYKRYKPEQ